jgi:hypothetical protein
MHRFALLQWVRNRGPSRGRAGAGQRGPGAFLVGNHRCCRVRVCQSPVLTRALAGGAPLHPGWLVPLQEVAAF